jgi:hypothetical protein
MSSKSGEFPKMSALLVGAALTGLIAGTSTAASATAASNAGQAVTAAGETSPAICRRACSYFCRRAV